MGSQYFSKDLGVAYYNQDSRATWEDFVGDAYIDAFIASGCALCSLASVTGNTPHELYDMNACNHQTSEVTSWLGLSDHRTTNYAAEIAKQILLWDTPVVVKVPGHFAVASGFSGVLSCDADGNPYPAGATNSMILITDPYRGRCPTLAKLISTYAAVTSIKY